MRDPKTGSVDGLTTAATVWVTAALGAAAGLGAWTVVVVATALSMLILLVTKFHDWAHGQHED